jgi:hypothetical protein
VVGPGNRKFNLRIPGNLKIGQSSVAIEFALGFPIADFRFSSALWNWRVLAYRAKYCRGFTTKIDEDCPVD